jgi:predicted CopG family antitoxin
MLINNNYNKINSNYSENINNNNKINKGLSFGYDSEANTILYNEAEHKGDTYILGLINSCNQIENDIEILENTQENNTTAFENAIHRLIPHKRALIEMVKYYYPESDFPEVEANHYKEKAKELKAEGLQEQSIWRKTIAFVIEKASTGYYDDIEDKTNLKAFSQMPSQENFLENKANFN